MLTSGNVSVSTTPTRIYGDDPDGMTLTLVVVGTTPVYYGPDSVTKDNGLKMASGDGFLTLELGPMEEIYGVTASGTGDVRYLATKNA